MSTASIEAGRRCAAAGLADCTSAWHLREADPPVALAVAAPEVVEE